MYRDTYSYGTGNDIGERNGELLLRSNDPFREIGHFPEQYRKNLKSRGIRERFPLQDKAIGKRRLLDGRSAILHAPTASGKTLIAEWCSFQQTLRGRQAWYIVPTRALAVEKFMEWRKAFRGTGVEVGLATGDWRRDDPAIQRGEFQVVISVVEKANRLIFQNNSVAEKIGLIVVDEAHLLGDSERGGELDFLLTWWKRQAGSSLQLILMSAVLSNAHEIGEWLGIEVINDRHRMTALREGTLNIQSGQFLWRDRHLDAKGTESLFDDQFRKELNSLAENQKMLACIAELSRTRGPVIFFVSTRLEATAMVGEFRSFMSENAISLFPAGSSVEASELFPEGIAIHTSDLGTESRMRTEHAFRKQRIRLLISTSTLEQGMNLLPETVVQIPRMIRWDGRQGRHRMTELSSQKFQNQGGRAGREKSRTGRSIIPVCSETEENDVWDKIISLEPEPVRATLCDRDLEIRICQMIGQWGVRQREELEDAFFSTFATWKEDRVSLQEMFDSAFARLLEMRMVVVKENAGQTELQLTGKGEFIVRHHLHPETFGRWQNYFRHQPVASVPEILFLIQQACEWADARLPVHFRRRDIMSVFMAEISERTDPEFMRRWFEIEGGPSRDHFRKMCQTLFLLHADDDENEEVESGRCPVYSQGDGQKILRGALWLLPVLEDFTVFQNLSRDVLKRIRELIAKFESNRSDEFRVVERLLERDSETPAVSRPQNSYKKQCAEEKTDPSKASVENICLSFPAHKPNWIMLGSEEIHLTEMQYRFVIVLARLAGQTVRYFSLNVYLWPEDPREDAAIKYHRRNLKKFGVLYDLISVENGIGIRLDLEPAQIDLPEEVWQSCDFPDEERLVMREPVVSNSVENYSQQSHRQQPLLITMMSN